jgi:hypothetical protein
MTVENFERFRIPELRNTVEYLQGLSGKLDEVSLEMDVSRKRMSIYNFYVEFQKKFSEGGELLGDLEIFLYQVAIEFFDCEGRGNRGCEERKQKKERERKMSIIARKKLILKIEVDILEEIRGSFDLENFKAKVENVVLRLPYLIGGPDALHKIVAYEIVIGSIDDVIDDIFVILNDGEPKNLKHFQELLNNLLTSGTEQSDRAKKFMARLLMTGLGDVKKVLKSKQYNFERMQLVPSSRESFQEKKIRRKINNMMNLLIALDCDERTVIWETAQDDSGNDMKITAENRKRIREIFHSDSGAESGRIFLNTAVNLVRDTLVALIVGADSEDSLSKKNLPSLYSARDSSFMKSDDFLDRMLENREKGIVQMFFRAVFRGYLMKEAPSTMEIRGNNS